jgi:drug/metabolite transporter (DMT)-like permease
MAGQLAALATAFLWSGTSVFFTLSARHIGAITLNRSRLVIGLLFLSIVHLLTQGQLLPISASLNHWFWLGLSGIIGLVLGDSGLFQAFVLIGPHLSMLMMTLVPILSVLFAWIFLAETLSLVNIIGIILTMSGIALVVLTKRSTTQISKKQFLIGVLCGLGGALGQATGLIIAKKGLYDDFSGLSATLIRVFIASIVIWLITLITGKAKTTIKKIANKKIILIISAGAFCGPFLGIWMSMNAIKWAPIGIASTIMALPPIILLPISHYLFKEKVTLQSVFGTIIAIIGTAVIFLW